MPILYDNLPPVEFVFHTDRDKPEETRPAILLRYISMKQQCNATGWVRQARDCPETEEGNAECYKLLRDVIGIGVVGWKNFDKPYSLDVLCDLLTDSELWELAVGFPFVLLAASLEMREKRLAAKKAEPVTA